ncbi:MAG: multidrug efflux RND transporter permease subunit [Armatimonadota bacterium]
MPKFFIHRPIFAIVVSLVIIITGGLSILSLPIDQYPEITPPTIYVTVTYPGADAKTVEESIAIPIEEQVNGADQMQYMQSISTDGSYTLICTFSVGRDIDMANVDVNNRVSKAMPKLPTQALAQGIIVDKQSPDMLMIISLYSPDNTYDTIFLSNYASIQMIDSISRTSGVGSTKIIGQRDYSMRLWVDPQRLSNMGLTAGDIIGVVNEQNVLAPAGAVGQPPATSGTQFQFTVNAKGRLETVDEFGNMVIRAGPMGQLLRIKDVARVELAARDYSSVGRQNGVPATLIITYLETGGNAVKTANNLKKLLAGLGENMPPGLKYDIAYNSTDFIHASIEEVLETLVIAIFLVLVVVFIFLGSFRATLIPMIAVPVSLIGTFAAFVPLGFTINTLTLFGIVLAVGLVVDDAIVVVEAVQSFIEKGYNPVEATEKAMDEVQAAVTAIALVLCAVFVPVAFMSGITGQLYKQFALTMSVSVVLSAIVALTLTPALCSLILKPKKESTGILGKFFGKFNEFFTKITADYTQVIKSIMRKSAIALLMLGIVWLIAGGLLMKVPTGFIPNEDLGAFFVSLNLPDGASLQRTDEVTKKIEAYIEKIPGMKSVLTFGGFDVLSNVTSSNSATIVCVLEPWDARKTKETQIKTIIQKTQAYVNTYPQVMGICFVPPAIPGLGTSGGFTFELEDRGSHTVDELDQTVKKFIAEASKEPELMNLYTGFRTTFPQLDFDLDRDKASSMGIAMDTIFQALQTFLGGYPVNDFNLFDRTYKVMVQAEADLRSDPRCLNSIYVRSAAGDMIPVKTLARFRDVAGPLIIQRYNMYREAEITGSPRPGYSSGQALNKMEEVAKKVLPKGYSFEWSGISYQEKLSSGTQSLIFVLAIIFVFLFLAALYESWGIPFSVILGIPAGVMGALLLVVLMGISNDVYVQIGIVMVIGLAAKNAILIVQFAKDRYDNEGMTLFDATAEGSKVRLRPILMTSLAFIFGVLPLLLATSAGAASRHSLGASVFGGMIMATTLGIFFIPLLYYIIQKWVDRNRKDVKVQNQDDSKEEGEK